MPKGIKGFQKGHKCFFIKKKTKPLNLCPVCKKQIYPYAKSCPKHRIFNEEWRKKLSLSRKGKKQSKETLEKLSKIRKGKRAWNKGKQMPKNEFANNWQGGLTKISERERKRIEYHLWRMANFKRDNFTCQKYGIKGGRLIAHHINNFADFPELRLAIDNGITLSEKAHKEFHKKYGVRNNTKEQLNEFLKN